MKKITKKTYLDHWRGGVMTNIYWGTEQIKNRKKQNTFYFFIWILGRLVLFNKWGSPLVAGDCLYCLYWLSQLNQTIKTVIWLKKYTNICAKEETRKPHRIVSERDAGSQSAVATSVRVFRGRLSLKVGNLVHESVVPLLGVQTY